MFTRRTYKSLVTLPGIEPGLFGLKGRRVYQITPQGDKGDFSVSRSVGLPVSGFESVQSFGLARNIHAAVDLDLAASPVKFSLSTAPYLIMAEILSAHQVLLYPRGVSSILSHRARCFWQREVLSSSDMRTFCAIRD